MPLIVGGIFLAVVSAVSLAGKDHGGACRFGPNAITHVSCTDGACLLCLDDHSCRWVTFNHCRP